MALFALWLADYQLLAAALLLGVMLALAALRQPAQRLAVAKSTLAALAALALLCALPGWSLVHLLSDDATIAEPTANSAAPAPAFSATLSTIEPTPDLFNAQPPESPAGGVLHTDSRNEVEPAHPISWSAYIVAAYGAGSAAVTLWLITGALLARRVRQQATPAPRELQELLQQLCAPEKTPPHLLLSDRITAPVALGLRRPTILLPTSTFPIHHSPFPISPSQLLPILAHELAHLQHRDLHTLAATRLLLILLWPQPLYWLLRRTIRLDQETLADAAAADRAGRLDYAQQLLAWASSASTQRPPRLVGAVGLWEGPSQLKRRIALLLNEQFQVMRTCSMRWKWLSVSCIAAIVAALSLVTLQPATDAAEDEGAIPSVASPEVVMARKNELLRGIVREKNSVRGYCVDEHGEPLAGAKISLFDYRSSDHAGRPHVFREALTDDRGYFSIDAAIDIEQAKLDGIPVDKPFDSAKGWDTITINAHAPGKAASYDHIPTVLLVQDGDLRMFELRPGKSLSGKVTDAVGRPVADVRVTAGGYSLSSATTDASGAYEIRDLYPMDGTPGHQLNPVEFRHPDFAFLKAGPATVPGTLDVTLQPGGTIEGRVEIQDGASIRPAANVYVMIARFTPLAPTETSSSRVLGTQYARVFDREWVRTNAAGEYRMQSLSPGEHGVTIVQNELVTNGVAPVEVRPKEKTTAPPIALTRGVRIRVKLIDAETKQPIPFDKLTRGVVNPVLGSPTIPSMQMSREFKPYGDFGEINVAPGKYSLFVAIPEPRLTSVHDRLPTGDFPPYHEFRAEEGKDLKFVIPMRAKSTDSATPYRPAPTPGIFIEGLDTVPDAVRLPRSEPAEDSTGRGAVVPSKEKSRVKSLKVQVLNRRGEPVVGAVVTPTSFTSTNGSSVWPSQAVPGWHEPQPQTTDAEGRATLSCDVPKQLLALFTPQDLLCNVEHPDYVVASNHEAWNEGTKVYILDEGAIIEFTTTAGGETLPAAGSYLLNTSSQRQERDVQVVEGSIRLPPIDAGVREIRAVHIANDGRPLFSPVVQRDLANGETDRLQLPVERGVRVEGQLDEAVPRPVKHGRVIAVAIPAGDFKPPRNATRPSWSVSATIKEDGTFFLEDLPAGDELKLIALCDGYFAPSQHFPETSDDPQIPWTPQLFPLRDRVNRLTLKMAPTATCEIKARDEKGDPVADAQVVIHTNVTWHLMLNGPYGAAMDSLDRLQGVQSPESRPVEFTAMTNKDGVARITNVASLEPIVYVSVQNANYRLAPISYALPFYGPPVASLALKPGQTARRPVNLVELGK